MTFRHLVHCAFPMMGAIVFTSSLPAQQLRGKVFDTYTRAALANATIGTSAGGATQSGEDGSFTVPCNDNMMVTIRLLGYERYSVAVADCAAQLLIGLTPGVVNLNAVNVTATRDAPAIRQPLSVTTLARQDLTRSTGLFLDDVLNTVPGVRMERRTMSGGQRITIRGYGNRTNFDGSGYKAFLNGIPLTDAEGVTMLDDVDFASLGKVDIIRGPASSLYGAGIAGAVNMYTLRPENPGMAVDQETMAGADGLLRSDTRFSSVGSSSTIMVNYGHQSYDSYRVHSASKKDHAMFLGDFRPSDKRNVNVFLTYGHSYDERAGQIDSAAFFDKLNVGEKPYLDNDGHVDMETIRAGITHSYRFSERFEPVTTVYFTGTNREDVFAVGLNPRSNQTFGTRMSLNMHLGTQLRPITGVSGFDFQKTNQFAKGYPLSNRALGGITTDLETHSQQYSAFSQWEFTLPAEFALTAGASVNFIEYDIDDRLANSGNPAHRDVSGRKTYDPVFAPRLSLLRTFGGNQSAYISWSTGFTPSTSSDAVIPFTGEPNEGLKPESASQVELGFKGNLLDSRLSYQLALFNLNITDKLTSQSVFNDQGTQLYAYTVNAGDQRNNGAELAVSYALLRDGAGPIVQFRPFLTYAYSDFRYSDFRSNNNDDASTVSYDGNLVAGVPKNVYTLGADALFSGGVYATATAEHRDAMPITYDNTHEAPGYTLVNGKAGVRRDLTQRLGMDAYVGVQNLTSQLYYMMVFLNGNYSGSKPPAIFLPGPYNARTYFGLRLSVRP